MADPKDDKITDLEKSGKQQTDEIARLKSELEAAKKSSASSGSSTNSSTASGDRLPRWDEWSGAEQRQFTLDPKAGLCLNILEGKNRAVGLFGFDISDAKLAAYLAVQGIRPDLMKKIYKFDDTLIQFVKNEQIFNPK